MDLPRFSLCVASLLIGVGSNPIGATETEVELLVSTGNSSSTVRRYNARSGNYQGVLGDPDFVDSRDYTNARGIGVDRFGLVYVAYRCEPCPPATRSTVLRFAPATGGLLVDPVSTPFVSASGDTAGFEGLGVSSDGFDLFVSQREFGEVRHYDGRTGGLIKTLPVAGTPLGLTVDGAESLYALSQTGSTLPAVAQDGQISKLIRFGSALRNMVPPGSGLSLGVGSAGLTFGPSGDLYVVDTAREKVLKYEVATGTTPTEFASPSEHGCVDPVDVAFGPHDGRLYVSCNTSGNIVRYDGRTGAFDGEFATAFQPNYLAFVSYALPESLQLLGPPNGVLTDPVTVFRWTPLDDPALGTYRVTFATDPEMIDVVQQIPSQVEPPLRAPPPHTAVDLSSEGLCDDGGDTFYWTVAAETGTGGKLGASRQVYSFTCEIDERGFTVIEGLVQSNLNQLGIAGAIAGASVAVTSASGLAEQTFSSAAETPAGGTYELSAATRSNSQPISGEVQVVAQKPGYISKTVTLQPQDKTGAEVEANFSLVPVAPGDLNGDGISDVLWRHRTVEPVSVWGMNNFVAAGRVIGALNSNWQIAGTGDFNGDGTSDMLWRNQVNGSNYIWQMTNFVPTGQALVALNTNWQVAGIGDFDGDGTDDIFWRNQINGANYIWKMTNLVPKGNSIGVLNTNWQVAGIGDFDGDGTDDIFWRNQINGANSIWKMTNLVPTGEAFAPLPITWQIAGIGDFNGDGTSDLFWRNRVNGGNVIWELTEFVPTGRRLAALPIAWRLGDTGDFNGDGTTDIVWRHSATGGNAIWEMQGSVPTNQPLPPRADTAWEIQR